MKIGWSELTFTPDEKALRVLATSWSWLLKEPYQPLVFSILGDVFFERPSTGVFWLNTGVGEIESVAANRGHFKELLATDLAEEWFLPALVEDLYAAKKIPGPGACYTFVTSPVFPDGKYEAWNWNPVEASQHFAWSGYVHEKLHGLPDGTYVKFEFPK